MFFLLSKLLVVYRGTELCSAQFWEHRTGLGTSNMLCEIFFQRCIIVFSYSYTFYIQDDSAKTGSGGSSW